MKKFLIIILVSLLVVMATLVLIYKHINRNDRYIGETVEFGNYYNISNEDKAPLTWVVVETDGDDIYLITREVIDCVPFITEEISDDDCVWSDSYIRKWLNNDFYNVAFSSEEKDKIQTINLKVLNHSRYEGGREAEYTSDKVFLMTAKQAKSLDESIRTAYCSEYASEKGVFCSPEAQYGMWWLMSPGYYNTAGACVDIYGNLQNGSATTSRLPVLTSLNCDYCGVRPMVIIDLESFKSLTLDSRTD